MVELYRFADVRLEGSERKLSFTLLAGEARLLQLSSKEEKESLIELALGDALCQEGSVDIVQGERRALRSATLPHGKDRRRKSQPMPLIWKPLHQSRPGRVGWVAANGGLISNLKVWENATLPLWYHARYEVVETEQRVLHWLEALGLQQEEFEKFMAAPPSSLELWQRKLAGLLRALVLMPRLIVVDAVIFEDIKARLAQKWITALEEYAAHGRAVLVITDKATTLPWKKIE